ncbi:hypothetical protein YpAngola_A2153 [Yersinia pestis Angola]|nr:hypothetical protein YpAngola_A2153 [Yersinia pestis Angola]
MKLVAGVCCDKINGVKPAGLKANHGVTGISIVLGNSTSISIVGRCYSP